MRSYTVIIITFSIRTNVYVNNVYCIVIQLIMFIGYGFEKKLDLGNCCP